MRFMLGFLVIAFDLLDNFTTFACLTAEPGDYVLSEANPAARWLFESIGLLEGLVLSTLLTAGAVLFLIFTRRIHPSTRLLLLGVLAILPAFAAANNLAVMRQAGISL